MSKTTYVLSITSPTAFITREVKKRMLTELGGGDASVLHERPDLFAHKHLKYTPFVIFQESLVDSLSFLSGSFTSNEEPDLTLITKISQLFSTSHFHVRFLEGFTTLPKRHGVISMMGGELIPDECHEYTFQTHLEFLHQTASFNESYCVEMEKEFELYHDIVDENIASISHPLWSKVKSIQDEYVSYVNGSYQILKRNKEFSHS